jgi:amidohydrolase
VTGANDDLNFLKDLVALRHDLHRAPELSGEESGTAALLAGYLETLGPDDLVTGLGGHGIAAVYMGGEPGPTVLLRADLDALPITETNTFGHRSGHPGVSHQCGHDGHMAMLAGVAHLLAESRPRRGRVLLLFQPAEENGAGARAVLDDPRFAPLTPDLCFGLHNVPGEELGRVLVRSGAMTCGSRGLKIVLTGRESHAAHPESGISPASAVAHLLEILPGLSGELAGLALATVVHARLGGPDFGTTPGEGEVLVTLRSDSDTVLEDLANRAETLAHEMAREFGLEVRLTWLDTFRTGVNQPGAVACIKAAANAIGASLQELSQPFRWSEDFAEFTGRVPGALFGLGAGLSRAGLHHPDYDFPDELIPPGVRLWHALLSETQNWKPRQESSE